MNPTATALLTAIQTAIVGTPLTVKQVAAELKFWPLLTTPADAVESLLKREVRKAARAERDAALDLIIAAEGA